MIVFMPISCTQFQNMMTLWHRQPSFNFNLVHHINDDRSGHFHATTSIQFDWQLKNNVAVAQTNIRYVTLGLRLFFFHTIISKSFSFPPAFHFNHLNQLIKTSVCNRFYLWLLMVFFYFFISKVQWKSEWKKSKHIAISHKLDFIDWPSL